MAADESLDDTEQYEHAGVWSCEGCGTDFKVVNKSDPLAEALACPDHLHPVQPDTDRSGGEN